VIDFLVNVMERQGDGPAVAEGAAPTGGGVSSYASLLERLSAWRGRLSEAAIGCGSVVSLEAEYGAESIAAFLALTEAGAIVVPLSRDSRAHHDAFLEIGQIEHRIQLNAEDIQVFSTDRQADHAHYAELRRREHPGLVLFSSGSTGKHKAAVHDLSALLKKYHVPRHAHRTLVFLQLDHIGGVNTLLYTLSNGGMVVVPASRSAGDVCGAIATHRVNLLPTSPTFLNLLLLSDEWRRHDLTSLTLITYGTETMPASTLARVSEAFPQARLLQTYGLTEVGILRSQSRDNNSLWVKVGGEGYDTRIVDGRLWIKAESAMLGYLNAPSPFSEDGYFDTGDQVEVDGEWLKILGRQSEIINVGGSKVYPAEVESVLLGLENVEDVSVRGEPNAITGQGVTATVRLCTPEPMDEFKRRMRTFCQSRLEAFKIPSRVRFTEQAIHSERFKRMR
jgi:long-chain acyl-CoA synthetase